MKKLTKTELEALANRIEREMTFLNELETKSALDEAEGTIGVRVTTILDDIAKMDKTTIRYIIEVAGYNNEKCLTADKVNKYIETKIIAETDLPYETPTGYHQKKLIMEGLVLGQLVATSPKDLFDKTMLTFKQF